MTLTDQMREEWKTRLRAVARAQIRYLYLLLLAAVFFWALRTANVPFEAYSYHKMQLPILGVSIDPRVILDCGPTVLGTLILALVGTVPALSHAAAQLGAKSEEERHRLDEHPTALDFVFMSIEGKSLAWPWGKLSYCVAILIAYVEALWMFFEGTFLSPPYVGHRVVGTVNAVVLLFAIPRLVTFGRRAVLDIRRR